jgi:divalent metal cation (Fe/Co/Zn/Cd) transporter
MNSEKTLIEAHDTAEKVHDAIEKEFPEVKHCMVHVNPDNTYYICGNAFLTVIHI